MRRLQAAFTAGIVLALVGSSGGQEMAGAAAKERERRAQQKAKQPARTFTNDDLGAAGGATAGTAASSTPDAASSALPASGRRRVSDNPEQEAAEVRGRAERPLSGDAQSRSEQEAGWRAQAATARQNVGNALAKLQASEAQLEQLTARIRLSTDTNEILRLGQEKSAAETASAEARAGLEAARSELVAFEERARRAGVPSGWIRQ